MPGLAGPHRVTAQDRGVMPDDGRTVSAPGTLAGARLLARPSRAYRWQPLSVPLTSALVFAGWLASVIISGFARPSAGWQHSAIAIHLLSLVVALGATVQIDWHGLLWIIGRRGLHEALRVADAARPLIWLGFGGLLASGTLLEPDLDELRTWVKLACVLIIGLNGAVVDGVGRKLSRGPAGIGFSNVPASLRHRMLGMTAISAASWWAAGVIGALTSLSRRG
ncbi:MAG: hypothetical protein ACR2P2_06595 [Nakamurella sp.]